METPNNSTNNFISWLKNKYTLILVAFVIWMIFFDTNSIFVHRKLDHEISEVNHKIKYYREKYQKDSIAYSQLKNSKEAREKYARENYFMKKRNEDIFIVVHKNDSIRFKE